MANITGLFRRGTAYYLRIVLPLAHPLRAERRSGRVVISLRTSAHREAVSRAIAKRAEVLCGLSLTPAPARVPGHPPPTPVPLQAPTKHSDTSTALPTAPSPSPRDATPSDWVTPLRLAAPSAPHGAASTSMQLRELHARWQAARAISDDSSQSCLRAIALFEKSVGDIPLDQINRGMGDAFRAWLQQQPTSSKTARDRLIWIKGLLNYAAVDLELIARNPWHGLDIKARTESPRQPWTSEWLARLLHHPIWSRGELPRDTKAGGAAAYWLPLLALYSGARCSELTQLRTHDIQQHGTIWVLRITDTNPGQQLKSSAARRVIPLHKELLRLGLLDYWRDVSTRNTTLSGELLGNKSRGLASTSSLWPDLPQRVGRAGSYFSNYFGHLRASLQIPAAMDFHSLRHTVRSNLLNGGVAESIIDRLLGHEASGSVGARVYSHPTLESLCHAIDKLPVMTGGVHMRAQTDN